jgi:hypothetical protein
MSTTRFSGPVAYSGGGNQTAGGAWFTNLPIQTNPDYVFQYEDFTGIAVDGTNDWTYSQLTSGTGAILADAVGGWYEVAGTGSDNTGASKQQIFTLFVIMGVLKPKPILALILLMVLFPAARLAVIVG